MAIGNKNTAKESICDWQAPTKKQKASNKSRILRFKEGFRWTSVKLEKYKEEKESWSSVARMVLTGNHGESAKFSLRYFEISPQGFTSLEKHTHEHVIICIRGRGKIVLDNKKYQINYLDTIYVSPNTIHQLINPYDEPFGFFCIVDSKRDKPIVLS